MTKFRNKNTKKAHYKIKLEIVENFAKELRKNIPKSEKWFLKELDKIGLELPDMQHNELFGLYIPDFMIKDLKVIIEVDGYVHNKSEVKKRDAEKDEFYKNNGYEIIRVKAYDEDSFKQCLVRLLDAIERRKKVKLKRNTKENKFRTVRKKSMCFVCQTYVGKHKLEYDNTYVKLCGYCIKLSDPFKLLK